jgi:hypothetical protein
MAQTSRTALQTLINSTIYTNVTNDITGDEVNDVCTDLNDSAVNWVTDIEQNMTNSANKVPSSAAVLANVPVKTVNLATWNSQVSGGQLRAGYCYIITKAKVDAIWGHEWSVFVVANSTSTIRPLVFAWIDITPNILVKVNANATFSTFQFLETLGSQMRMTTAQIATYNTNGVALIAADVDIITTPQDIFSAGLPIKTKTDNAGTFIELAGYAYAQNRSPLYTIDTANDLALPTTAFNFNLLLSAGDLAGGTAKEILPAIAGHYWSVLDCQAKVNWNTTGFDTTAKIEVSNETATSELYTFDNLDQLLAGSIILRGQNSGTGDVASGEQYIANTRLVAQCMNPPTAGDGTVGIYVTAQLVQA